LRFHLQRNAVKKVVYGDKFSRTILCRKRKIESKKQKAESKKTSPNPSNASAPLSDQRGELLPPLWGGLGWGVRHCGLDPQSPANYKNFKLKKQQLEMNLC